jgi:hypothetical protein
MVAEQQEVIAGLQEQNALLRQQVAALQHENAHLRSEPATPTHRPDPWPSTRTKQEQAGGPRKKRDRNHNRGRQRMAEVNSLPEPGVENASPTPTARDEPVDYRGVAGGAEPASGPV